jgi:hypothetical protein
MLLIFQKGGLKENFESSTMYELTGDATIGTVTLKKGSIIKINENGIPIVLDNNKNNLNVTLDDVKTRNFRIKNIGVNAPLVITIGQNTNNSVYATRIIYE